MSNKGTEPQDYVLKEIVVAYARLRVSIPDPFFLDRLDQAIHAFLDTFTRLRAQGDTPNVAQYYSNHRVSIQTLRTLLEELQYLKTGDPVSLLTSYAELLRHQIAFLRASRIPRPVRSVAEKTPPAAPAVVSAGQPAAKSRRAGTRSNSRGLSENQRVILDYIRQYPRVRSNEIVSQFNALSARTVKRNLQTLVQGGLIKKNQENNAMYYSIA
ncbi:MAG TPA: hypothetical protein VG941_03235 [Candidatus Paceibacterota bacterium]|nr:hypothetical protein [Candidatus Paceibacterota bacterium]